MIYIVWYLQVEIQCPERATTHRWSWYPCSHPAGSFLVWDLWKLHKTWTTCINFNLLTIDKQTTNNCYSLKVTLNNEVQNQNLSISYQIPNTGILKNLTKSRCRIFFLRHSYIFAYLTYILLIHHAIFHNRIILCWFEKLHVFPRCREPP